MKQRRLLSDASTIGAAAILMMAGLLPIAHAAPALTDAESAAHQSLSVPAGELDGTAMRESHVAAGELSDATAIADTLVDSGPDTAVAEASTRRLPESTSMSTAEAAIDPPGTDASILPTLPAPDMKTQVPGLSETDLLRYKRQMLRKDI